MKSILHKFISIQRHWPKHRYSMGSKIDRPYYGRMIQRSLLNGPFDSEFLENRIENYEINKRRS
jgi:hypothetical protein